MQITILVLLAIPTTLLIVILASACYQAIGSLLDERLYPPHGRLVDVGGCLSSQGKLILAKKSGRKIHIDEPELVVDGIHRLCLGEKPS